jgi:hypothetical protein
LNDLNENIVNLTGAERERGKVKEGDQERDRDTERETEREEVRAYSMKSWISIR